MKEIDKLNYRPFTRFCMSIAAVPSSYLAGLTIEEQLLWFCSYLEKEIIPAVNNNGEAVTELQELYVQLKNYVDNYFDNLDVQEEINNKLDAMAESGELEDIIASYLETKSILAFDSVADLKDADNLAAGSYVETYGFYTKNDKGGAKYSIREITNSDTVDNVTLIALTNFDDLVAELIIKENMCVKQFGVTEDGETDDSDNLQLAINFAYVNDIVLHGNYQPINITKTIFVNAYNKLENLYLITSSISANFTNGFMMSVNSNNASTWVIEYPHSTLGYIDELRLENTDSTNIINGIYNCANNEFKNIRTRYLNKSFENSRYYLDVVKLYNIQVSGKTSTDYAIILGFLGDSCELDTAHIYATVGTENFITGFNGHNAIILNNIICNGNMLINGGNTQINNIHSESGTITINGGAICTISNGYLYHNDPNIDITNSYVTLNQLEFCYFANSIDYSESNDIDINITTSNVDINDCYKSIKVGQDDKLFSIVKTNLDSEPTLNRNKKFFKNPLLVPNEKIDIIAQNRNGAYPALSEKVKWHAETGHYYYKAIPVLDIARRLRNQLYEVTADLELTNNEQGFKLGTLQDGTWRVYRGTTSGSYDVYVDIANCSGSLHDDGVMCNGYKWQSRVAGAADEFDNQLANWPLKYNGDNIECYKGSQPSKGTWKKGDIVYKNEPGADDPIGWICTVAGTPGTWKAIS